MQSNAQIILNAQKNYIAQANAYANDQLYGTKTCTYTLDQLVQIMLLLLVVTNSCLNTTPAQYQCAIGLLNLIPC